MVETRGEQEDETGDDEDEESVEQDHGQMKDVETDLRRRHEHQRCRVDTARTWPAGTERLAFFRLGVGAGAAAVVSDAAISGVAGVFEFFSKL